MTATNNLVEVKPGFKFHETTLKIILPDVETALFFAKTYKLDFYQLGSLLHTLFDSDAIHALTAESGVHSSDLQDYLVEIGYEAMILKGDISFSTDPPKGEILPELWRSLEIDIARSIQDVAEKLKDVIGHMPGKEGQMLMRTMMSFNAKRPVIGDYRAHIHHAPKPDNLVILDVSGSMSENTVHTIIEDVVALSYTADAHLAIVSDTTTWWEPGGFDTEVVLKSAEYGGTHYETLSHLLNKSWGVVVTIADYDSSWSAAREIAKCTGSIELLLDISLVSRPTYLSEVVGQLAQEVRPLLVAADDRCCM